MQPLVYIAGFIFIALAARQLGSSLSRFKLPLISGYLFAGIIAGPFVLGFISTQAVENLRFLDEISLSFIAFAAGSELYLRELKSRFRSIAWHTAGQLVIIFFTGSIAVYLLLNSIPFAQGMSETARLSIAILIGAILVARSPSSAIAIVNELRAKGAFTKTLLGVTIVMDVVVVVLFAVVSSVADVALSSGSFDVGFILLLALELALTVGIGFIVGKVLEQLLASRLDQLIKIGIILLIGLAIFNLATLIRETSHTYLPFELLLEPLLICMVGSFVVTNYSAYRAEFLEIVHDAGPVIYIIFFTLVGSSLRLDILMQTLVVTVVIFGVRLLGLFLGSFAGGTIAGDPPQHSRLAWMAYITQAGIGLGLAKEAALEFPELGDEFSTLVVSVIVLSQLIGPPFLNFVIKRVGEAHIPGRHDPDDSRDVLILGAGQQGQALAQQLRVQNWLVTIADIDREHVETLKENGIDVPFIPAITSEHLSPLITDKTDALVAMLGDDAANYNACELAYEAGIPRLIARLNDYSWAEKFEALGVKVVYQASAVVNLLSQFVIAPQSATLLLQRDPVNKIVQIRITEPDVDGMRLRNLRLPTDVLVLGIMRDGTSIVPHGHTVLRRSDEMTLVGHPSSLDEVTRRLGF